MEVWLTRCRRRATCKYCSESILKGEYMIVTRMSRLRRDAEGNQVLRRWRIDKFWHPDCWMKNAKQAIDERQPLPETRGRKKLNLSPEAAEKRRKVLMRRASVMQRLRDEMDNGECNVEKLIHLGSLLQSCKEEIEQYGEVPKSW